MRWRSLLVIAVTLQSSVTPQFEVASIRSNSGDPMGATRWSFENGRFTGTSVTVQMLVSTAYGEPQQPLADFQIAGGPQWLRTERFDVTGTVAAASPGTPLAPLLRHLLEDRFQLRTHQEVRELPIYALMLANADDSLGPRLRRRTVDCAAVAQGAPGERCGGQIFPGTITARGTTMVQIISGLTRLLPNIGRLVVDQTGLSGSFDLDLTWLPDDGAALPPGAAAPPIDPNAPTLFTALREQLGVKLEPTRGPVPVMVIDAISRPTEN
jgi:uncharacterized protein (TIGR03435 family)